MGGALEESSLQAGTLRLLPPSGGGGGRSHLDARCQGLRS